MCTRDITTRCTSLADIWFAVVCWAHRFARRWHNQGRLAGELKMVRRLRTGLIERMNSQAHMWGDLRSAIHNGQSALDLSTRLDRFTDSDREHALQYLLEHVGGSEAFWHGMSQGHHMRLSWLLPMMTAQHIQLIDSALHGIHFELEREVGFKLQQLEVDIDWLLQW